MIRCAYCSSLVSSRPTCSQCGGPLSKGTPEAAPSDGYAALLARLAKHGALSQQQGWEMAGGGPADWSDPATVLRNIVANQPVGPWQAFAALDPQQRGGYADWLGGHRRWIK